MIIAGRSLVPALKSHMTAILLPSACSACRLENNEDFSELALRYISSFDAGGVRFHACCPRRAHLVGSNPEGQRSKLSAPSRRAYEQTSFGGRSVGRAEILAVTARTVGRASRRPCDTVAPIDGGSPSHLRRSRLDLQPQQHMNSGRQVRRARRESIARPSPRQGSSQMRPKACVKALR